LNLPFYIAKRYLISKKSHHVINIISWISVSGIGIATMALVIVLSAFNGLQTLVENLYASFDPDIKITALVGKTFDSSSIPKDKILAIEGIQFYTESIEDVALFKYSDKQTVATLKGVEETFYVMTGLDTLIYEGKHKKDTENTHYLNLGYGIANNLSLFINSEFNEEVSVIIPKKGQKKSFIPGEEFSRKFATASGVYSIGPDFDNKYVLASLPFVQTLFDKQNQISSVELKLKPTADWQKFKVDLQHLLGKNYVVKTRYELNELVYKTNETEKWITFLILSFILVIASFNIIGSLTMLILDKKEDVWILKTMGANNKLIQQLFFAEGMLINLIGALSGMLLGALLCWLQMEFGLLRLNGGIVDFYPIEMKWIDFASIAAIVLCIGIIASWFPVRVLTRKYL
jgi:lipoprotein-releasing system permease protein